MNIYQCRYGSDPQLELSTFTQRYAGFVEGKISAARIEVEFQGFIWGECFVARTQGGC